MIPTWLHRTKPLRLVLTRLARERIEVLRTDVARAGLHLSDEQVVDLALRVATPDALLLEAQEDMYDRERHRSRR
jgi:hypothetical protein